MKATSASNEDCPMDEPDNRSPASPPSPMAATMAHPSESAPAQAQQEHHHHPYHHHPSADHGDRGGEPHHLGQPGSSSSAGAGAGSRPHSPEHPHPHHAHPNYNSHPHGPAGQHYPQEQLQQHQSHPDHHQYPESRYPQEHSSHGHNGQTHHPYYPSQQQQHPSHPYYYHPGQHGAPSSPSPPLPTMAAEPFQGRPLPPIDPSHPLHNYMSTSRRGSLADSQEYHPDMHRRSSAGTMEGASAGYYSNGSNNNSASNTPGGQDGRHYANSSTASSNSSTPSDPHYPHQQPQQQPQSQQQQQPPVGPNSQHLRPSVESGRRESLPSIYSSAGPLGQLLSQEPARRHSIAHSDAMGGPLKRKTSTTPLSQVHSSETLFDHPSKRRDSIPDAAMPSTHPYPARNSYSAPSSPPRRASVLHGPVPVLNLQPAAEIKPSYHGPPASSMDHHRPHLPLHQPRRPSLLSDSGHNSRRSSLAEVHHPYHMPSHRDSPQHGQQPDYVHHMNDNMEKMHLSGHRGSLGGEPPYSSGRIPAVGPAGSPADSHMGSGAPPPSSLLHPGYPAGYPADGELGKGETPYSRSPELRVSHKLAERKRRKEMKELFDELRDSLPVDRSLKTSKWEILSKAVDFIAGMKANHDELNNEVEMLRREVARLKQQQQQQ
ncbi:hypothetical protein EMPS_00222 [Entomortierella parvispora]|uniref:BHLH domain-containing protein n=1 Tax=Entomortierella parvispora TaxID=205924 RepID=A0A9P3GZQ7_9FUNG|nr:hypothetical protein EMPS_00222 [Entomortierella parvispora]